MVHGRCCLAQSKRRGESKERIRRPSGQVLSKEVLADPAVLGGGEDIDPAGVGDSDVDRACPRMVVEWRTQWQRLSHF